MPFSGLHDGIRCQAVAKATGERCRCVAVRGKTRCAKHGGGGRLLEASIAAKVICKRIEPAVPEAVRRLPIMRALSWPGRARLYEAAASAAALGDPVIWQDALRAVSQRYRRRLEHCGVVIEE